MKRKRKELRVEMRLASQTAKNLKRRRNKLMKVWQPEFCASQPKLSSIVVRQPATYPAKTWCNSWRRKATCAFSASRWSTFFLSLFVYRSGECEFFQYSRLLTLFVQVERVQIRLVLASQVGWISAVWRLRFGALMSNGRRT